MGKKLSILAVFTLAFIGVANAGTEMLIDNSAQYAPPPTRVYAPRPPVYYAPPRIVVVAPAYRYYAPRRVCRARWWH